MKKIDNHFVTDVLKAVLYAVIFSFAGVLILAIFVKFTNIGETGIVIVNSIIKTLAVLFGVLKGFKGNDKGLIKGLITGILYVLLVFFIFAACEKFDGVKFNYFDLLTGAAAGGISDVIKVNLKKKQ